MGQWGMLRKKNPVINKKGYRKSNHTEWIHVDYGHDKLKEHLNIVVILAKAAGFNWTNFKTLMDRSLPQFNKDGSISLEIGFFYID
ncbi:MAG: hypothetical protein JWR09_3699 [Mucilaginibacter sp.]|nr:hypothetical protein [Mucilaginibacter sp.]